MVASSSIAERDGSPRYGATPAEFFAWRRNFRRARRRKQPELYAQLAAFYRQDPASYSGREPSTNYRRLYHGLLLGMCFLYRHWLNTPPDTWPEKRRGSQRNPPGTRRGPFSPHFVANSRSSSAFIR